MTASRRTFLTGAAASVAFAGLARLANAQAGRVHSPYGNEVFGYGALVSDPQGLLDLPQGFAYQVISTAGEEMSDGLVVPERADGMGCFDAGGGRVILIRNHENYEPRQGAFGKDGSLAGKVEAAKVYDFAGGLPCAGGTTRLTYNLRSGRLIDQHLSSAGTVLNCAGGITPRRTWLTCEETVTSRGGAKSHGWVFEVPADGIGLAEPTPIAGLGRFVHEATCTDPKTGIVYLTEDSGDGLFYRFLPIDRNVLAKGGLLQALALDADFKDTRNWREAAGVAWRQGERRRARWIDLEGVDNPHDDLRLRGHAAGAAIFARGEGVWWGDHALFFTCTSGGAGRHGQVMRYRPDGAEGGELTLFVESSNPALLRLCDNVTVMPNGHLLLCEDRGGEETNHLRGVTPEGRLYTFARNARSSSEFAGACFSPDGSTLFVNLQEEGLTLVIIGPWNRVDARTLNAA